MVLLVKDGGSGKDSKSRKIKKRSPDPTDPSSSGGVNNSGGGNSNSSDGLDPSSSGDSRLSRGIRRGDRNTNTNTDPNASGPKKLLEKGLKGLKNGGIAGLKTGFRRAIRGATGGKYSSFAPGKGRVFKATAANVGKGILKLGGSALGAGAGFMLSTADAVANGNFDPKKVMTNTLVGAKAGNKQVGGVIDSFGDFADEVGAQRAKNDKDYADYLRREQAIDKFAPDLEDLTDEERDDCIETIGHMAPFVDLKDFNDVKALQAAKEGDISGGIPAIDDAATLKATFERAKGWRGDLQSEEQGTSFMKRYAKDILNDPDADYEVIENLANGGDENAKNKLDILRHELERAINIQGKLS